MRIVRIPVFLVALLFLSLSTLGADTELWIVSGQSNATGQEGTPGRLLEQRPGDFLLERGRPWMGMPVRDNRPGGQQGAGGSAGYYEVENIHDRVMLRGLCMHTERSLS
jgi:hypothetical protein